MVTSQAEGRDGTILIVDCVGGCAWSPSGRIMDHGCHLATANTKEKSFRV